MTAILSAPRHMAIVYDGTCNFCIRCAAWISRQQPAIALTLLPSTDPCVRAAYGRIEGFGQELMVVADNGQVWSGPDAFIVAMWCLAAFRHLACNLSGPLAHRSARAFFHSVSQNRSTLGQWLDGTTPDFTQPACGPGQGQQGQCQPAR
jgi:predicted DCC family thiol-disulfide oxidoreductase YuxK